MIAFLYTGNNLHAQINTPAQYKGIQANLHYGTIFAHSEQVQNTAGAYPRGIELQFFKQRVDTAIWDLCNCFPVTGLSVSYFNYNTPILGHSATLAYYLEPAYRISNKSQFRFKGAVGVSYLSNPYHPQHNPTNMSYSTHVSGYLQVGVGITHQLGEQTFVQAGANYQHVSNGGLQEPNKGINWPTATLGLAWVPQSYRVPVYRGRSTAYRPGQLAFYEIGVWASAKQGIKANGNTPRTPSIGLVVQASKQVGRTNALNIGVEGNYDNALLQQLAFDSIQGSAYRAGVLAGHEFLLGKFYFSQQLGFYLFNNSPYYTRLYHRYAFKYRLHKSWLAGIGLKAHKQVAEFLDLRLMYQW